MTITFNMKYFKYIILFTIFYSCKKELKTCTYHIYYFPVEIAFKGYTKENLKEVIVAKYKANNSFDSLVGIDTFDYSNADFYTDTACHNDTTCIVGLYRIQLGYDYIFNIVNSGDIFKITDIKCGDSSYSWEDLNCGSGSAQPRFAAWEFNINGKKERATDWGFNHYLFCLRK